MGTGKGTGWDGKIHADEDNSFYRVTLISTTHKIAAGDLSLGL